jgi:hypothetical protein
MKEETTMDILTGHLALAAAVALVIPARTAMSTSNARAISQPLIRFLTAVHLTGQYYIYWLLILY